MLSTFFDHPTTKFRNFRRLNDNGGDKLAMQKQPVEIKKVFLTISQYLQKIFVLKSLFNKLAGTLLKRDSNTDAFL